MKDSTIKFFSKLKIILLSVTIIGCIAIMIFHFITEPVISIAHKGHNIFTPNTSVAFKNAKNFDAVECDVWITTDNYFVISHDATIKTKEGEYLLIYESSLEEITKNCGKVTMLEEFLTICKENGNQCVIDIKQYDVTIEQANILISTLEEFELTNKTILLSWEENVILIFKNITNIELYFVFNSNVEENTQFCIENSINACMNYKLINKTIVQNFHAHGLKVNAWTIDEFFMYMYYSLIGVDYITSDIFN